MYQDIKLNGKQHSQLTFGNKKGNSLNSFYVEMQVALELINLNILFEGPFENTIHISIDKN